MSGGVALVAGFPGEGGGGDAEGVEEVVGSDGVEVVGCDAGGDLGEGEEDGAVVLEDGEHEGHLVVVEVAVGVAVGVGAVGGVVVEAEGSFAEGWRAALVSGGMDVAAAGTGLGYGDEVGHDFLSCRAKVLE